MESEKSRMIREIYHAFPYWKQRKLAELCGISPQRLCAILKEDGNNGKLLSDMVNKEGEMLKLGNKPITPTEIVKKTGIPFSTIAMWIKRGQVKLLNDPGQTGPGIYNLIDPVSLQERINKYRPKRRPASI